MADYVAGLARRDVNAITKPWPSANPAGQGPIAEADPCTSRLNRPFLSGKEFEFMRQAVVDGKLSGDGEFTKKCHALLETTQSKSGPIILNTRSNTSLL